MHACLCIEQGYDAEKVSAGGGVGEGSGALPFGRSSSHVTYDEVGTREAGYRCRQPAVPIVAPALCYRSKLLW